MSPTQFAAPPTDSTTGNSPNALERFLPTAGGILGGLVTAPLEALDAVSGVGGTALNVAGAGAGASLGKALENKFTHQGLGNGVLGAGVSGAVGQAGGALLGKGAQVGGGILSKLGGNVAGKFAAKEGADAATDAAGQEADRVANEFGGVKSGVGSVGDALDKAHSLGITNPTADDLTKLGNVYTGSNPEGGTGVLNFYKQQALDQAGGNVDVGNVMEQAQGHVADVKDQLGDTEPVTSSKGQLPQAPNNAATGILKQVRDLLPADTVDEAGQLTQQISPQDGVSLLSRIGDKINATTPQSNALGLKDPADMAENNVWRSIYQDVKSAVYNRPEVDAAVKGLSVGSDESSVIDDAIKSNGITDPQVAANIKADITNTLNGSQSAQDLLSAERPMVNVSKVGTAATKDIKDNPQSPRGVRRAKASAGNDATPSATKGNGKLGTMADLVGAGGALTGHPLLLGLSAANHLAGSKAGAEILQGGGGLLSKLGDSAVPGAIGAGAGTIIGGADNSPGNAVSLNNTNNNSQGNTMNPQTGQPNNLFQSLIPNSGVSQNYSPIALQALLGMFDPSLLNGTVEGNAATAQGTIQKANQAASMLPGLTNEFNQAGGGQGALGGLLSRISGILPGSPASIYNSQATQEAQALKAAGVPASESNLPQLTQNGQSAQDTLQNIQSLLTALGATQ